MLNSNLLINRFKNEELNACLADIYSADTAVISKQNARYIKAVEAYNATFGEGDVEIYSAPGRTEIGGNHTDHQHGRVLAGSIDLDAIAIVGMTSEACVRILSEGYDLITIPLSDVDTKKPEEEGTTTALIKGVLHGLKEHGYKIGSFQAYITSDVLGGSGLSSSAAFETLLGTIISGLYNNMKVSAIEIAIIGQYAENVYFGKPCGLLDQTACSVGGFVSIDFKDPSNPIVNRLDFDINKAGYSLCIVDTKGSHAGLTDDYAAVPAEMKNVANYFGKEFLADVDKEEFYDNLPSLIGKLGDREILRAFHFFNEDERVPKECDALASGNFDAFLALVKESGDSSYKYLQNVYSSKFLQTQAVPIALAMTEQLLGSNGVCRVHGGGFAGTIQAFVKTDFAQEYKQGIERILGEGTCHILNIRKYGGMKVL